ncbi:MAG: hypothetical protein J6I49_06985 [Bacteroidales bacterium]|nr:hypothetical protein [Bacteroidales bacterium]
MQYRKNILTVALLMLCVAAAAQDKGRMRRYEDSLAVLIGRVSDMPTDNERYLASEETVQVLCRALEEEGSEKWRWQLPPYISFLASPDNQVRLFTWAVVRDDGVFECFGVIQYFNEREDEYQYKLLLDKSEEIINREESLLSADRWLGAVYQDIIQVTSGERTYYTLLGWNGVDNLTERKMIEPLTLRGGVPQFGGPLFRRERNLRRIVLEYTNEAMVNLSYETQVIQEVERKREKVKGTNRYRTVEKIKEHREAVIIFDEVEPQVPGMEGLFHYYVPSGTELAYAFVDGKWELRKGAQGRLTDKKLNKDFAPLPKTQPSYKYDTQRSSQ